jgi:protein-S-isoprenylcysteine O-methyltransferase Ste14
MDMINSKLSIWPRLVLAALAIVPLIYWQPFYLHFKAYLTGTVITGIVQNQWHLVLFFILFFGLFAIPLSYRKRAKWVDYSLVGAFFVSLFVEMYGIPLTLLFASKYLFKPGVELPENVVEFGFIGVGLGMDHAMLYGAVLMLLGLALIARGWWSLYRQARNASFASQGLYAWSRNPQYAGFILVVVGWFFGWPTILTLVLSPILIWKYLRAARAEEGEMVEKYGDSFNEYAKSTLFLV